VYKQNTTVIIIITVHPPGPAPSVATPYDFTQDLGFFDRMLGSWVISLGPWAFLGFCGKMKFLREKLGSLEKKKEFFLKF